MMKKRILATIILVLLIGCKSTAAGTLTMHFDANGYYTGFKGLSDSYTSEQAVKDGCYVRDGITAAGGEKAWKSFIDASSDGKEASIRIVSLFDGITYYKDLFYSDGKYHIFDSSSDDLSDHSFRYLLELTGRMNNAVKDSRYVVLTDDKKLSFQEVTMSMISSNMEVIRAISPYQFVLIGF